MTCEEFWSAMPELGGRSEDLDHVRQCPACAGLLERQRALAAGLNRVAQRFDCREAPRAVEARLREAFRAQHAGARPRRVGSYWLAWGSAAALVGAAVFLTVGPLAERNRPSDLPATAAEAAAPAGDMDSNFVPLPYGAIDSGGFGAVEDPDLVRVEVPQSALIALGLPVEGGAGRVEAVVALGAGGMLQGIQIVQ